MNYAPIARIIIRYSVGLILGVEAGNLMAAAKRKGWAT